MTHPLSEAEKQAYLAPFPSPEYEAGIIEFPLLIAVQTDNPGAPLNRKAWEKLKTFDKPFLTIFGALDPVSRGWERRAQAAIPGAKDQDHFVIEHANHFIQEDAPEILVERILRFLDR
jgi:haloalkane dehalogenase